MSEKYFVRGLAHVGIYTDNPKRCADFYAENLGFHSYHQSDRGEFQIYFVENSGHIIEFVGKGSREAGGAVDHIAIEVQGIEAMVLELKEKGILEEDAQTTTLEGLFSNSTKNIFFKGPAGERIELFDYTNCHRGIRNGF